MFQVLLDVKTSRDLLGYIHIDFESAPISLDAIWIEKAHEYGAQPCNICLYVLM